MSALLRQLESRLLAQGLPREHFDEVAVQSERTGLSLFELLQRSQNVDAALLCRTLSELTGLEARTEVDLEAVDVDLVRQLPLGLAREQGLLPLASLEGVVEVAIASPEAVDAADDLRVLFGQPVRLVLLPHNTLRDAINKAFDKAARTASAVVEEMKEEDDEFSSDLSLEADILDDPNQAPIIRFVNSLLTQAIKDRASDIHVEPFEKELAVRFRIDGVLYEVVKPPPRLQASIVSRVKIMAGLNIAEKRIPQDGRIRIRMAGREIDLRVSTLPVRHGERVVMRILEKGEVFTLDGVGMEQRDLQEFRDMIRRPHGIILVTGPTGSGKTTTLYSALSEINAPDLNILTIEDPVEYELKGIGQTQVNPKIKLTFASALRAHLRQDPDVIMVGEIRDKETADNAVQASLTGHLVFSTLHTNDAAGAFTRLIDMGVEPFLVSSSLLMVVAQRLVRRLCPDCKEPYTPSAAELADIGLKESDLKGPVYRAKGCPTCINTGYTGRMGIYEMLFVRDNVRQLVMASSDAGTIKRAALSNGMRTLRVDGLDKALQGHTSFDEVLRVTQEEALELD
ncbi:MAG: type II secretion system ATPase GspE [Myxococcota bacterium]|nr:type II secretion system ATPase GspE [Myxococcota bacterium]